MTELLGSQSSVEGLTFRPLPTQSEPTGSKVGRISPTASKQRSSTLFGKTTEHRLKKKTKSDLVALSLLLLGKLHARPEGAGPPLVKADLRAEKQRWKTQIDGSTSSPNRPHAVQIPSTSQEPHLKPSRKGPAPPPPEPKPSQARASLRSRARVGQNPIKGNFQAGPPKKGPTRATTPLLNNRRPTSPVGGKQDATIVAAGQSGSVDSTIETESTASGVGNSRRRLREVGGPSVVNTAKKYKVTESEQPEKVFETRNYRTVPRLQTAGSDLSNVNVMENWSRLVKQPNKVFCDAVRAPPPILADTELTDYLRYKYCFVPRTNSMFQKMAMSAKQWLATHDCSKYTHADLYRHVVAAVKVAMVPTESELEARKIMTDPDINKALHTHRDMLVDGTLGFEADTSWCIPLAHRQMMPKT